MDERFDLHDVDFQTALRVAKQRGMEARSAAIAEMFTGLAVFVRGLFAAPAKARKV